MNHFDLTPDLQTGVESIDELHGNLLRLVNRATAEKLEHYGPAWLCVAVEECVNYLQYVFAAEEQLMQSLDYAELPAHRRSHNDLRLEVCELVDAARKHDATKRVQEHLARAVETLLVEHFRGFDLRLAEYARQQMPPNEIHLHDSATLMRAGALVAEVVEPVPPSEQDCVQPVISVGG